MLIYLVLCLGIQYNINLRLSILPNKKLLKDTEIIGTLKYNESDKIKKYIYNHKFDLKSLDKNYDFVIKEGIFGKLIYSQRKCLTYTPNGFLLEKCCKDTDFCIIRQSFKVIEVDKVNIPEEEGDTFENFYQEKKAIEFRHEDDKLIDEKVLKLDDEDLESIFDN